jgi:predicted transposase YdaD
LYPHAPGSRGLQGWGTDLETRTRSAEIIVHMSNKTLCITEELYEYMLSVSLRETDVLRELRDETRQDENANMQIPALRLAWCR